MLYVKRNKIGCLPIWGTLLVIIGFQLDMQAAVPSRTVVRKPRAEFFKDIMGMDEKDFRAKIQANPKELDFRSSNSDPNNLELLSESMNPPISAGRFDQLDLGYLRKAAEAKLKRVGPQQGKFSVIEGDPKLEIKDWSNEQMKRKVDVGALQADPANKDAVFALASNFNGLETIGTIDNIGEKPLSVDNAPYGSYLHDNTQGPLAAISAAPGLIYRTYYMFNNDPQYKNDPAKWRQTQDHEINFLDGLGINILNGYITDSLPVLSQKIVEKYADKFKIGYHSNIQVTNGFFYFPNDQDSFYDQSQLIDQAFAAALAIDYFDEVNKQYYPSTDPEVVRIGKLLLDWTYEAILKAAYVKGKKKVFLPRVGGGAFNNKPEWIDDAILKQSDFIKNSGMEVILNNFDLATKVPQYYPLAVRKLLRLVSLTNGKYTMYYNSGNGVGTEYGYVKVFSDYDIRKPGAQTVLLKELTNDFPVPVEFEGMKYPSALHAIEASKFDKRQLGRDYRPIRENFTKEDANAVALAKLYAGSQDPAWKANGDAKAREAIIKILYYKFGNNKQARDQLYKTGINYILYNSADELLGTGEKGNGDNLLGLTLTQVRDELRRQNIQ